MPTPVVSLQARTMYLLDYSGQRKFILTGNERPASTGRILQSMFLAHTSSVFISSCFLPLIKQWFNVVCIVAKYPEDLQN